MVSVPKDFYGLSESEMRDRSIAALFARNFLGGSLVFHPLRYNSSMWVNGRFHLSRFFYAPHFHFLSYLKSNYDVCRLCKNYNSWGSDSVRGRRQTTHSNHGGAACLDCTEFEGLTRRLNREDNFIVKVFSKRGGDESIFSTALYELGHAGFEANTKHVHIVTWFGNCSPRRFKADYQSRQMVCPEVECKSPLVRHIYTGSKYEIVKSRLSPEYKMDEWLPILEDGKVVWSESGGVGGG
jgi:hypothetical protein